MLAVDTDVSDVLYDECEVDEVDELVDCSLLVDDDWLELDEWLVLSESDDSVELDELYDDSKSVDELVDDVALDELVSLPPTANEVVWAPQHWNSTLSAAVRPVRNTLTGSSIGNHMPS